MIFRNAIRTAEDDSFSTIMISVVARNLPIYFRRVPVRAGSDHSE